METSMPQAKYTSILSLTRGLNIKNSCGVQNKSENNFFGMQIRETI